MNIEFWKNKYHNKQTGWDIGYPSPPITSYVNQIKNKNIKILIPGCGNAHEAEYLLSHGFRNVYVLDFVKEALINFKERFPDFPNSQLVCQDFFKYTNQFDLIIEQTFFCALPRDQRNEYSNKIKQLLVPNGKLIGLFFSREFDNPEPPFGGSKEEYESIFSENFNIKVLENCYNSIQPRKNNELFFIFENIVVR